MKRTAYTGVQSCDLHMKCNTLVCEVLPVARARCASPMWTLAFVIACCVFLAGLRTCRGFYANGRRHGAAVLSRPTLRLTANQLRSSAASHGQHTRGHTCQPGTVVCEGVGSAY